MERKKEQKIDALLDQFVKSNNLERGLAEYRITKAWSSLLGKSVAKATKELYIKDRKLFVHLYSSVVRQELSMIKQDLIIRLNEEAGMEAIEDIILR